MASHVLDIARSVSTLSTLDITLDGLTIADVLNLTVDEAAEHFADRCTVHRPLHALQEVGLGYLVL